MPRRGLAALVLFILADASVAPAGTTPALPMARKYLEDRAGVFEEVRWRALNEKLAAFERSTSDQVVVIVDRRLPEEISIEELANRTFRDWKIGQKGGSNGVLFLVFIDDRKMRIEVGYGLEGAIPDARAHRITDEIVKPHFRKGDYPAGIEAGVDAIFAAARGEPYRGSGRTVAESKGGPWRWLASLPNDPNALLILLFLALLLPAVLVLLLWRRSRAGAGFQESSAGGGFSTLPSETSASSSSSSSNLSDSSSDSSSSSSDFSGGGGDSGGGGSSDSW